MLDGEDFLYVFKPALTGRAQPACALGRAAPLPAGAPGLRSTHGPAGGDRRPPELWAPSAWASSSATSVIDRADRINPAARLDIDPGPNVRSRCHHEIEGAGAGVEVFQS